MAINVSQAFHRTSANPVDESLALTKAQMAAVNDNLMPAKYLTVCQDDGAIYLYDKTNTPSVETGKFVKFEGGGGSITVDDAISSTSENPVQNKVIKAALDTKYDTGDTAFTGVVDGDYFPVYDTSATTKKKTLWSNIKSLLKSYFDGIYSTISTRGTPTSGGTTLSVVNTGDMYAWNVNGTWYATSSTGASTTAKVATLARGTFTLTAGARVAVKFTYTNTASAPTLNVGSTGAKNIKYVSSSGTVSTPTSWWGAGDVVTFVYDGTQFLMQPALSIDGGQSYTAGDGIDITNNEISTDNMPAADMSEVISPLPGVMSRRMKYSTEEQVIGEWIDSKPIYEKTIEIQSLPNNAEVDYNTGIDEISTLVSLVGRASRMVFNYSGTTGTLNASAWITAKVSPKIRIHTDFDATSVSGSVTIQYTKP